VAVPADNSANASQVALVTGASRGIGRALALELARTGHDVALCARDAQRLEQVAEHVRAHGAAAFVVAADLGEAGAGRRVVDDVLQRFGRLDVVIANAGAYLRKPATDVTRDDLERMFAANFWSAFETVQAALPTLREQRAGHVVLVNSFDAKKGLMQDSAYVAAKCALAGFAATLRQALRGSSVHVCSAFPGRVDTDMIQDLEVPAISRKITPERVARAVLRGMRRRRAEVIVPWHIRPLWWADVLSPRLGDWLARRLRLDGRPAP